MNACTLVFIGMSGCGKGTQVELIKKELESLFPSRKVSVLETGKYFREIAQGDKPFSASLQSSLDEGNLAPDKMANAALESFLSETPEDNHIILDGYPRTLPQVAYLADKLDERKGPVIIISYKVSEDTAIKRIVARAMTEKRGDSNVDAIAKRISYFKAEVEPVIDCYRNTEDYHFVEVDGEKTIPEVFEQIMDFFWSIPS